MQAWNHLVTNNPMSLEGIRAARRFLRTGGETGRAVNYTVFAILGFIYVWLLLAILRYREDMTVGLLYVEAVLLTLVVPASLYAAVSGEREKLTWDSLIMTRLTPGQIIAGKILWRIVLVLGIMTLFTIPMLLCHYAAGMFCSGDGCTQSFRGQEMSVAGMWKAQWLILAWSLLLASVSFFASTKSRRPITTMSILTVAMLAFLALTPMLVAIFGGRIEWRPYDFSPLSILGSFLVQMNPFCGLVYLVSTNDTWTNSPENNVWISLGIKTWLPWAYVALATLFLVASRRVLRGMEAPRRTIG